MQTFAIATLVFLILATLMAFGYLYINKDAIANNATSKNLTGDDGGSNLVSGLKGGSIAQSISNLFSSVKEHTNFIIMSTDEDGTRTDTMIVGIFNSKTNSIDLISLPRDTQVVMPKERRDILAAENIRTFRSDGSMKLNEVHHHAGEKYGVEFCVLQVEELLNIKIEYYVKVDLEAFRFIVDSIGGVEFDVPRRMNYHDPIQNLSINIQPGLQVLDGAAAEGVVRFRKDNNGGGYADGDIGRVKVQQDFVKALIRQVISKEDLLKNVPALVSTYFNYVDTNFNISDIPKYLPYLSKLDMENIVTHTLPGRPVDTDRSYWIADQVAITELTESILYNSGEIVQEDSFDKNIVVLNGAGKQGAASANKEMLEQKGYKIQSIGDYTGQRQAHTRIVVKRRGLGKDLQQLYDESQIIVDSSLSRGVDIQVILGTGLQ